MHTIWVGNVKKRTLVTLMRRWDHYGKIGLYKLVLKASEYFFRMRLTSWYFEENSVQPGFLILYGNKDLRSTCLSHIMAVERTTPSV
jgi:hypothetical protein